MTMPGEEAGICVIRARIASVPPVEAPIAIILWVVLKRRGEALSRMISAEYLGGILSVFADFSGDELMWALAAVRILLVISSVYCPNVWAISSWRYPAGWPLVSFDGITLLPSPAG